MFTATEITACGGVKPTTFMDLGNGVWYYNYNITSEVKKVPSDLNPDELVDTTFYSFIQVRILGKPTYSTCVLNIIRLYISDTEEFDLINSYNKYLMGESVSLKVIDEYSEYLQLLSDIKTNVAKDFKISTDTGNCINKPKEQNIATFAAIMVNTVNLTDSQALVLKDYYPKWADYIGKEVDKDFKMQYDGKLFKVVLKHTVLKQYPPSISTASLYTLIIESQSGTIDDPIDYPSDGNLVIYKGKYYKEDETLYLCIRDSGQPLYTKLANVVDNYVTKV